MSEAHLVSVIITSYNYGPYLAEAIESALKQTYARTEVIVVDDGSVDASRAIIARYGDRIIPILKENGGQASAFNAGFAKSSGDVLLFLDSDDVLCSTTAGQAVDHFRSSGVAKVHWNLRLMEADGTKTERVHWPLSIPAPDGRPPDEANGPELSEGDLREAVLRGGPFGYAWPVTSGNAWARRFIERIFPMPEKEFVIGPDLYLATLAPLFGTIQRIKEPQGFRRIHAENHTWRAPLDQRVRYLVESFERCFRDLRHYSRPLGLKMDLEDWEELPGYRREVQLHQDLRQLAALIAPGEAFILVDDGEWGPGEPVTARRRIPFLERDGQYWGRPADDASAMTELERLRQSGACSIVFIESTMWWLQHYAGLHRYLRSQYRCLLENKRLVAFDLRR
jgi:glycosyltransferase involved in cell wall biosynthesis